MSERAGAVTMKGNPLTLIGPQLKVGDQGPDFTLVTPELQEFKLSSLRGKIVVISAVPSLDTSVCDRETRRFNEEAAKLGDYVVILTISMDLPFAQKRWCGAAGIERVKTLSDHRDASFGQSYGVLIKELRLLARTVFVLDKNGRITYIQALKELTTEPSYDEVLKAVASLRKTPAATQA